MDDAKKWYFEKLAERTVEALKNNGINAYYVETGAEARELVTDLVEKNATIGHGGSLTLKEIELLEAFKNENYRLEYIADDLPADIKTEKRREIMTADYYFTGTNALTVDGKLVNIDATGNRVASMIFGPGHVIVFAGINKIHRSLEEALNYAQNEAAVINAKRLKRNTPCTMTGKCEDCNADDRICNVTTIIDKKPTKTEMTVVIIGEQLGY